jgi:hypothetical protein
MTDLPHRLSQSNMKVTFRPRRGDARTELTEAVGRKYVRFTEMQDGTGPGFQLDEARPDLAGTRWERGEGTLRLAGDLKLDGVPLRVVAGIDLASVEGVGRLEPVA